MCIDACHTYTCVISHSHASSSINNKTEQLFETSNSATLNVNIRKLLESFSSSFSLCLNRCRLQITDFDDGLQFTKKHFFFAYTPFWIIEHQFGFCFALIAAIYWTCSRYGEHTFLKPNFNIRYLEDGLMNLGRIFFV